MGEHFRGDDPAMGRRAGGTATRKTEEGIDIDCLHAVLDNPRRRLIVDVVTEVGAVTMRDLATQVVARERDVPPHAVTDDQRREVTIALHHVHVPKLADVGLLEIEGGMDRLRPGPNAAPAMEALAKLYSDLGSPSEESISDA